MGVKLALCWYRVVGGWRGGAVVRVRYSADPVAADDDERRSSRGFPRRAALVQCRCRHRRRRLYLVLLEGCSVTRPFLPSVTRWMTAGSRGPPSRTRRHISVIAFRQKITIYHIYDIQCKTAFHKDGYGTLITALPATYWDKR